MALSRVGRLLVVDDEADTLVMLCDLLGEWGYETKGVESGRSALLALKESDFDLLLTDLFMPEMDGIELLRSALQIDPHLVGIVITGKGSLQTAMEAVKNGAFDYLLKPPDWKLLGLTLSRAMEVRRLRKNEEYYRTIVEANSIIMRRDTAGNITFFNEFAQKFFGYSEQEILGRNMVGTIVPATDSSGRDMKQMIEDITQNPERYVTNENENIRSDGERVWIAWTNKAIRDRLGRIIEILCVGNDITGRKRAEEAFKYSLEQQKALEAQLMQAQKMEAVGTLAGGVAHDFNNILTAVISYLNILLVKMQEDDPLGVYVKRILESAEKATTLVHSLLAFSRNQIMSPQPVDVNTIIQKVSSLLARLIGENIELKTKLSDQNLVVMGDKGHMELMLMNLAANARDAMPDVGALTIGTDLIEMDERFIKIHGFGDVGRYAMITVSDTGEGMDEKTRERIFEPFFTTKEVGKGTGLGLAMVYGIIKQHDGHIICNSESGNGTSFRIYLPLTKSWDKETPLTASLSARGGTETVLLAEDNADVRMASKEILEDSGYQVVEAVDGEDAIRQFMENADRGKIALLILDVIMPKKNGKEVYDAIKEVRPDIKVLFVSGYPADIIDKKGVMEKGMNFILKPFPAHRFLTRIRDILDGQH